MISKIKRDPKISSQQRMVIDIVHTANWLDDQISKVLKGYGITHPQFNILKNVEAARPEPLSVKEIKESIMFKNSDITRLIDRLVKKDLLSRATCEENRRKLDVTITTKASSVLDEITEKLQETFRDFYKLEISEARALETSDILRLIRNQEKE